MTAYSYDWNMLLIGQPLWSKALQTYIDFPPLQNLASDNLEQVYEAGPVDERVRRNEPIEVCNTGD